MRRLLIIILKLYRFILSPYVGQHCRFTPTCSSYAIEALETHDLVKGLWLSTRRILKCHPWCEGGYDPVPHSRGHPDHG